MGPSPYQEQKLARAALLLAESITGNWDPGQRDCAGFIRFVYRTGLHLPSDIWKNLNGEWTDYVGAAELISANFSIATRQPTQSELVTGDVLVYYNPTKPPTEAWHLMMIVKAPDKGSNQALVVYHNGDRGPKAAVRKVRWSNLFDQTSLWQPTPSNPIFQGVYRWRGWSQPKTLKLEISNLNNKDAP